VGRLTVLSLTFVSGFVSVRWRSSCLLDFGPSLRRVTCSASNLLAELATAFALPVGVARCKPEEAALDGVEMPPCFLHGSLRAITELMMGGGSCWRGRSPLNVSWIARITVLRHGGPCACRIQSDVVGRLIC
jgi:hypothetical protein